MDRFFVIMHLFLSVRGKERCQKYSRLLQISNIGFFTAGKLAEVMMIVPRVAENCLPFCMYTLCTITTERRVFAVWLIMCM